MNAQSKSIEYGIKLTKKFVLRAVSDGKSVTTNDLAALLAVAYEAGLRDAQESTETQLGEFFDTVA